ncbi:MAG: glycoside hydrolase family 26 protein [Muribaculaceae bacterium]|jgi:mannan endo-1,4-beta-mannosidase
MNTKSLIFPVVACGLFVAGCGARQGGDAQAEGSADSLTISQTLMQRLENAQADSLTIYGHDDDPVYGVKWFGDSGRSDVLETVGDYPGMMHWDLGLIEVGSPVNLDSVSFDRMRAEMLAQHERGGINAISWHPINPANGKDAWQPIDTDVVTLAVTDGTAANDSLKAYIGRAADYLATLRDSDGNPLPLIMRPWHEMSGGWFWWGGPNTTVESYRKLWAMMREAFDSKGLGNSLLWAYSPDVVGSREEYMTWYPGDEYVDILGADVYHRDGMDGIDTWLGNIDTTYGAAVEVAREKGKIAALTETGCEGLPVTDWYTRCLLPVVKKWHPVYVTVWRNGSEWMKKDHYYAPYPGHPGVESFKVFHDDNSTVFAREMDAIR